MFEFFRNTLAPWQWGLLGARAAGDRCAVLSEAEAAAARGAEHLSLEAVDRGLARQQPVAAAAAESAAVPATAARSRWRCSRCCGRVGKARSSTASGSSFWSTIRPACRPPTSTDAKNRLEEAKKLVGGLIDQMDSGMTAMIISFADTPQVVQEFTDNRRLLRERLATIEPTVRGTDLHGALELADGLANPEPDADSGRRSGNRRRRSRSRRPSTSSATAASRT